MTGRGRHIAGELTVTTADGFTTVSPVPPRLRPVVLLGLSVVAVVLAGLQIGLGRSDLPIGWLAAVPLAASLLLSVPAVLVSAMVALALAGLVEFMTPGRGAAEWARLSVLLLLCAFAIINGILRQLAAGRLEWVRDVARVAQGAILHEIPPFPVRRGSLRATSRPGTRRGWVATCSTCSISATAGSSGTPRERDFRPYDWQAPL